MYRLVRDATRFVDGHHVKDLNSINRDLSKVSIDFCTKYNPFFLVEFQFRCLLNKKKTFQVIVIDWNGENVKYHPENVLRIPRWNGNDDDTTLYDLAAFLKSEFFYLKITPIF